MASRTRTFTRIALAIAFVVGVSGLVGCKRAVSFTPLPSAEQSSGSIGNATGTAGGSAIAKQTGQATTTVGAGQGAKTGTAATAPSAGGTKRSTGANAATTSNKPAQGTTPAATSGLLVRIIFWNDTTAKARTSAVVVFGTSSFKPNTSAKFSRGIIGPAPFKKKLELAVYPNGLGGKKIVVPFTVTPDMLPNSEQDAIHVAVSDSSVRVLGNAVFNFDQTFAR